jgi:cytochrome c-type biogenesis protein CcmH/NrfG
MEWVVLVAFAAVAAAAIGLPLLRARDAAPVSVDGAELLEERRTLLAELRELDDDAASGRISVEERRDARRAFAPRLRAVAEALRDAGLDPRGGA